jgi:hypothetical protein
VLSYFFYELNMIATVHDYYLFPFLPLIFLIVGFGIQYLTKSLVRRIICLTLLCVAPVTAYLRVKNRWDKDSVGFNKDLLTYKNQLRSTVPSKALSIVGNDQSRFIFFYFTNTKGWAFDDDKLKVEDIITFQQKGAQYLFSDSRNIDSLVVSHNLGKLIGDYGSINVYELKP